MSVVFGLTFNTAVPVMRESFLLLLLPPMFLYVLQVKRKDIFLTPGLQLRSRHRGCRLGLRHGLAVLWPRLARVRHGVVLRA